MLDTDQARELLDPAADFARALREALELAPLTPEERRAVCGKWFGEALHFAGTAARARERHEEALCDVPHSAEHLRRQMARVLGLELALGTLERLCKDGADTLLAERARLYDMAAHVLKAVDWHAARPGGPPDERDAFATTRDELRRHFNRRNQKVSQSKRARARRAAPPPAPALLPTPLAPPPAPLGAGPVTVLQIQLTGTPSAPGPALLPEGPRRR